MSKSIVTSDLPLEGEVHDMKDRNKIFEFNSDPIDIDMLRNIGNLYSGVIYGDKI